MSPRDAALSRRALLRRAGAASLLAPGAAAGLGPFGRDRHALRWTFDADQRYLYLPARVGDALFVGGASASYGLDPATGERRWKTPHRTGLRPAATGDAVAVFGDRDVYLLGADGERRWRTSIEEPSGPDTAAVHDVEVAGGSVCVWTRHGLVVLGGEEGEVAWRRDGRKASYRDSVRGGVAFLVAGQTLLALDAATGEERWRFDVSGHRTRLLGTGAGAAFVHLDRSVVALELADGTERWRYGSDAAAVPAGFGAGSTVVADGAVYLVGSSVWALDAASGDERWTYGGPLRRAVLPPPLADDALYAVERGGASSDPESTRVVALERDTGEARWRRGVESSTGLLDATDGVVYVPERGGATALATGDGTERWSTATADRAVFAAVLDGTVYFGAEGGTLLALAPPVGGVEAIVRSARGNAGVLSAVGAGAAALLGAAAWRRYDRLPADAVATVARDDRRVVYEVERPDGRRAARTVYTDDVDGEALSAFAAALDAWAARSDEVGVLPVFDWGTDPSPWFETARAAGGSVADDPEGRGRRTGFRALRRACRAVSRAPAPHGDLTPGAILLGDAGDGSDAAVRDWGLAAFREAAFGEDPAASPFAAPEEPAREGSATDVYRLGAVGYFLVAGRPPARDPGGALRFDRAPGRVPDDLRGVLETALAPDPADRHDSPADLDDMLQWAVFIQS